MISKPSNPNFALLGITQIECLFIIITFILFYCIFKSCLSLTLCSIPVSSMTTLNLDFRDFLSIRLKKNRNKIKKIIL